MSYMDEEMLEYDDENEYEDEDELEAWELSAFGNPGRGAAIAKLGTKAIGKLKGSAKLPKLRGRGKGKRRRRIARARRPSRRRGGGGGVRISTKMVEYIILSLALKGGH